MRTSVCSADLPLTPTVDAALGSEGRAKHSHPWIRLLRLPELTAINRVTHSNMDLSPHRSGGQLAYHQGFSRAELCWRL